MPKGIYKHKNNQGFKKGHKNSEKTKRKMSLAHTGKILPKEEMAFAWKGNKAGVSAIHEWVKRWKGKPDKCEKCGTTEAKKFEWANIDHKYRRVLDDYIRLCTKCHREHDSSFKKER